MSSQPINPILLINQTNLDINNLSELLTNKQGQVVQGKHLLSSVREQQPNIAIIFIDSPTENDLVAFSVLNDTNPLPILMFANHVNPEDIQTLLELGIDTLVIDGYDHLRVPSLIELTLARFKSQQTLIQELDQVKNRLQDRKVIDRAKGILMRVKLCDEETAYQLLRKQAMSSNQKMVKVAQQLINSQQLLQ